MKIAVLTEIINRKSGARAPLEIAKALKKLGNEVTVFAYGHLLEKEAQIELKEEKVQLETFSTKLRFFAGIKLAKILKDEKFDVISFHGTLSFFFAALFSGIPIVRTYYGTQLDPLLDKVFPSKPSLLLKIANRCINNLMILKEKFVLSNSDKVFAISQYTRDELKEIYKISSEVVYLGAAPESFKKRVKSTKKKVSILSVSRIVPYKEFHKIIKIFTRLNKKFPNIKLTIIGSSPNKRYLNYLKKIANKNVKILTDVSDEKLIKAYQQADVYATFDRYMFFGMPILEAASCGIPSIAIARCAATETIDHGKTGFLANNETEFASFLEKLIQNPKLRNILGNQAHKSSQCFSWDSLAKRYNQVFPSISIKKKKELKPGWALLGIIVLGSIFRLGFMHRHAFWFDEAFSYFIANRPFTSLLRATAADNNPPFYYLLLKLWLIISSEVWFLRLLSTIFGILSIYLVFKICQKLTNSKTAILATAIFVVSPLHIYFSTETRMYSLLVFESLLLFLLFLKFCKTRRKSTLALISLIGILASYTHYYSGLIILALNVAFLILKKRLNKFFLPWIMSQLSILLAILPWFLWTLKYPSPGCWCFHPFLGLPAMFVSFVIGGMGVVTLKDLVLRGPRLPFVYLSLTAILALLIFLRGLWVLKNKLNKNSTFLVFFFVPILTSSIIAFLHPLFSPRSLIIVSPLFYLLIALGLESLKNKLLKIITIQILFTLLLFSLVFQYFDPFFYGPPLEDAALFVAEEYKKEDAVLHSSPMTFYSFQYLHNFSLPEFLIIPSDLAPGTISEIGGYKKPVEEIVPSYSKVWLVNALYWVTPQEISQVRKSLIKNFTLEFTKHYNNIEIYQYIRQQ